MNRSNLTQNIEFRNYLDSLYKNEIDERAKFSMLTSLTPVKTTDEEAKGYIERYKLIKEFWNISQNLFKKSLSDKNLQEIRDLILNEVNPSFSLDYHKRLYENGSDTPYFFRTDECIPGKITEIQSPGSGWGNLNSLQSSLPFLRKYEDVPIRSYNTKTVAEKLSTSIKDLTKNTPFVYHQIDESSNMLDLNYFISVTRKLGLKYLGWDFDVSFNNVKFLRTHSFMEQVTGSMFPEYLRKYGARELLFDIFPSILFFQKIPLTFPFWEETRSLYSDEIREIFPFASLVTDKIQLENGERLTVQEFSSMKPTNRDYYLKYGGVDGTINWGSKGVFHLGKANRSSCLHLLEKAKEDHANKRYWILQKAYNRKEKIEFLDADRVNSNEVYSKWSGFYGPDSFLGGYVMSRDHNKVHGQNNTICRLIL